MQKIIISGCSGHMGRVVESLCAADPQVQVAAGFDILGSSDRDFPVFSSPAQFSGEADAVIDFSSPAALEGLLDFARSLRNFTFCPLGRVYSRFTYFPTSAFSLSTLGSPSICKSLISFINCFLNSSNCPLSLSSSYLFQ